jgi:hypothetical protein
MNLIPVEVMREIVGYFRQEGAMKCVFVKFGKETIKGVEARTSAQLAHTQARR